MRTHTRTALVSLLAIALLAWFLSHADLAAVARHVRAADRGMLAIGFVFVVLTYVVRTFRWLALLRTLGPARFRTTWRTTIIGFAALGLLPARAGDILRPYLLARRDGLPMPSVLATVVLERVLDLVAVLGLLGVFVWGVSDNATLPARLRGPIEISAALAAAAAAALFVMMWVLASHPERIGALVLAAGRVLPQRVAARLADLATVFSRGFAAARSPRALLLGVAWSFPVWVCIAGETWAVSRAFDIAMPFTGSFLVQAFLVIGIAVPTPGGVGSYHEAYRLAATTFFHAPNDAAVAAAIVVHAISFVPVILVGLLYMAQDGLSVGRLQELAGEARDKEIPSDEVSLLRPSRR